MWSYASFKTKGKAFDYLKSLYAEGLLTPSEVYGIIARGGRFHIMLKGA
jgi:hypothetical protein